MATDTSILELTAHIVAAYVEKNPLPMAGLPDLVGNVSSAVARLSSPEPMVEKPTPAVDPKRSVRPDHIVCLEDGKKFKSLKRHLASEHGLTPNEYRQKWDL
jgi:predicted transcriptional regulator